MNAVSVWEIAHQLATSAKSAIRETVGQMAEPMSVSVEFPLDAENDVLMCAAVPDEVGLYFRSWMKGLAKIEVTLIGTKPKSVTIWPQCLGFHGVRDVKIANYIPGHMSTFCTKNRGLWKLGNKGMFCSENEAYLARELIGTVHTWGNIIFFNDNDKNSLWMLGQDSDYTEKK